MRPIVSHPWDISIEEAWHLQQKLSADVVRVDCLNKVNFIAGVDVAYQKNGDKLIAAIVILHPDNLDVIESVIVEDYARFPYIPGLFSFREMPSLIKAFALLKNIPDLIVCDGQGIAHPRRFGLACHLGIAFDIPAIGCGKTRLIGEHKEPEVARGSAAPLIHDDEIIGNVLRTQAGIKPMYVSIGHKISLSTACDWILKLTPHYRLPETTRKADQLVRAQLKARELPLDD